jgi:hypothetical protein
MFVTVLMTVSGCSHDFAMRTAYETLQNAGQQECLKRLLSDCLKREDYDDYQRKLKELESSSR